MTRSDLSMAVIAAFLAVSQAAFAAPLPPEDSTRSEDGDGASDVRARSETPRYPDAPEQS
jgi:hypothetical protein